MGKINMLHSYLQGGIFALRYSIRISLIIFCIFTVIKFLLKRKVEFKPISMICEFAWIITISSSKKKIQSEEEQ